MTLFPKRSARALWQAGDRARDARNWPEARSAYAQAIKLVPSRYGLWLQYGHAAKESGDAAEAEAAYRTAIVIDARRPEAHLQLGYLMKHLGRWQEAEQCFARVKQLDPGAHVDQEIDGARVQLRGLNGHAAGANGAATGSRHRFADSEIALLNVKQMGYALARALGEGLKGRTVSKPPRTELASKPCTQADLETDWAAYWAAQLKTPLRYHRKVWEFCYIAQALWSSGKLKPGSAGLGFGCGDEPLVGVFAKHGAKILATDLPQADARRAGWVAAPEDLQAYRRRFASLCSDPVLRENIQARAVDMRDIPADLKGSFDFCWSACSLEHLGSIAAGLQFIESSMETLKPGGVAVHTTEFNVNDGETLDHASTVLFQRQHMEEVARRLTERGFKVAKLDFSKGDGFLDGFVDLPPWPHSDHPMNPGEPDAHLKLSLDGFVCTSFGLIAHLPGG